MNDVCFKVRDKSTGKFWNGNRAITVFNDTGASWKNKKQCEKAIAFFISYRSRWTNNSKTTANLVDPNFWEIVELELIPKEKASIDIADFFKYQQLKIEMEKSGVLFGYFAEAMYNRNVLKDIEFVFKLKPAQDKHNIDMRRIKEARQQLRQLGVKTRTFREHRGLFGMMDRQQALKARLVLDIEKSLDLGSLRTNLKI